MHRSLLRRKCVLYLLCLKRLTSQTVDGTTTVNLTVDSNWWRLGGWPDPQGPPRRQTDNKPARNQWTRRRRIAGRPTRPEINATCESSSNEKHSAPQSSVAAAAAAETTSGALSRSVPASQQLAMSINGARLRAIVSSQTGRFVYQDKCVGVPRLFDRDLYLACTRSAPYSSPADYLLPSSASNLSDAIND